MGMGGIVNECNTVCPSTAPTLAYQTYSPYIHILVKLIKVLIQRPRMSQPQFSPTTNFTGTLRTTRVICSIGISRQAKPFMAQLGWIIWQAEDCRVWSESNPRQ